MSFIRSGDKSLELCLATHWVYIQVLSHIFSFHSDWYILTCVQEDDVMCKLLYVIKQMFPLPSQGTLPYHRHIQYQVGRFVTSNEVGKATQAIQSQPRSQMKCAPQQFGRSCSLGHPTSTIPGMGVNHPHTRKNNIDTETSIIDVA